MKTQGHILIKQKNPSPFISKLAWFNIQKVQRHFKEKPYIEPWLPHQPVSLSGEVHGSEFLGYPSKGIVCVNSKYDIFHLCLL